MCPVLLDQAKAHWVKKGGQSVFGYKQHTAVDDNGLVIAVETTAANQHDSQPMLALLDKAAVKPEAVCMLTKLVIAKSIEKP